MTAATLQIQFTGLDIEYDGSLITTIGGSDLLNTVTLSVDGSLSGPPLVYGSDNIFANLTIPVENLPATGGVITMLNIGSFDLGLVTGGLGLILDKVSVQYLPLTYADFFFAGALASINGQDLPYGLVIGDPVTLSISAQIASDSFSVNPLNNILTGFTAAGTGEISGTEVVPIPTAIWLFSSGLICIVSLIKRKKGYKHLHLIKQITP
ncbi:MAG: hypothetical protein GY699_10630 [Desulfobacteraceae bacterium]|nr:hypothetical protein [Desulfobacteraceae bacterium]